MGISYYAYYLFIYIDFLFILLVNGVVLYLMRKEDNIFKKALVSAFILVVSQLLFSFVRF